MTDNAMSVVARQLTAAASGRTPQAVALLEALVNYDTSSHAHAALATAAGWIEEQLRSLGLAVERRLPDGAGPVLIGRASGRGRRRILFLAHYDTVFEPGEPGRRPFKISGGRAYGPGVADMKGGVITLWEALRALRSLGWEDFGTLTVIHNPDEEIGSHGSRAAIEEAGRSADICLVLEPGRADGSVVTARKGVGRFLLTVHGKAAHAGVAPQEGASAVVALAQKIVAIDALNDYARGLTLNTIITRGGARANIVADEASAEIDVRIPTLALGDEVVASLQGIARAVDLPGTRATLTGEINRPPFEPGPGGAALLALARDAAAALGLHLKATTTGGGSDGNFIAALGVPVLDGLGAVGGGYHSPDEYLELQTLPQRAALTALLTWLVCGSGSSLR
jgi:glutamate carboxypeptidase